MRTVLVVAPDDDLRRSIDFALSAEGLDVRCRESLAPESERDMPWAGCLVLDEKAIEGVPGWKIVEGQHSVPVVLLVDRLRPAPESPCATSLAKPLLGQVLVDAVVAALGSERCPAALRKNP